MGFGGKRVNAIGKLSLAVSFGDTAIARTEHITFDVVEMPYPYCAILGRGAINKFEAVVHQLYLCMKIPAPAGVITIRGDQQLARDIERGYTPGQKMSTTLGLNPSLLPSKSSRETTRKQPSRKTAKSRRSPLTYIYPTKW